MHPLLWKTGKVDFDSWTTPRGTVIEHYTGGWLLFFTHHEERLMVLAEDKIFAFDITGAADPNDPRWQQVRRHYGLEQEG
jgi:hypothetical protein